MNEYEECVSRSSIVDLLSDEEVAKVSMAETAPALEDGEEYIDLLRLERGVQRAGGVEASMHSVLPRRALRDETWSKVVRMLTNTG